MLGDESFLPSAQRKKWENPIQHIPQQWRRLFDSLLLIYSCERAQQSSRAYINHENTLSISQPLFGGDPFAIL